MPAGQELRQRLLRVRPERVARGDPPLLGAGARQRREPDHVADGVDVRHGRAEVLVHRDQPARGEPEPGRGRVQLGRRGSSGPAHTST